MSDSKLKEFLKKTGTVAALPALLSCYAGLSGCGGHLKQQTQIVNLAPVSKEHNLTERLKGRVYILPAEASTGQEQYASVVSNSFARTISGYDKSLEVLSVSDFVNTLNEKDLSQKYSEMRKFYKKNQMFKKSDLEPLGKALEADYFVLLKVLDIKRGNSSRMSAFGLKLIQTQIISAVLDTEIWNTKGYKVFSATSDTTMATESIGENPISIEEAFGKASNGIVEKLPK